MSIIRKRITHGFICNGRRSAMTTLEPVHKEIYATLKIPIELIKVKS